MPLYIGDYLGDTQRLTTEQHGAYLLLLMDYWRNGPPPSDDAVICQITRLSRPSWRKMKPVILAFFTERAGRLIHGRADKELAKASDNQERRSAKAKKAASARWTSSEHASGNARGNATGNASSNASSMPDNRACPPPSPKKGSDDKSSGETPVDFQKRAFDLGVEVLGLKGTPAPQARSLVGKWRKVVGDERVGDLLEQARDKADPVEWVAAAVNNRSGEQDALFASIDRKYAGLAPVQQ
ncbi:MAG: hypothetical protein QOH47_2397 [Sphingomonadales bacterium]|jgi:uncharacterized protein YdaU (DUF1376 family)|nr:hypothetical protein [Sphingomonadales bacterium]